MMDFDSLMKNFDGILKGEGPSPPIELKKLKS
jgi:hypothetical protein